MNITEIGTDMSVFPTLEPLGYKVTIESLNPQDDDDTSPPPS